MLELRTVRNWHKAKYYHICDTTDAINDIAIFDNIAEAALALRYLNGGNLTDADLERAREIFKALDTKQSEAGH